MGRINLLDDRIINQIAAGEVVENPASVIKELAENSLDAGATSLTIEFEKGGTELIRIIDNGCGMDDVDAKTAFIRHATSKISSAEDLTHISTMGFRGEALASISEVSNVVLQTSTGDIGTKIVIKGGICQSVKPIGFPRGTTIEVSDLFFNTPARKKFLKSSRAETTAILELCQKFILANPEVSFKVINNGRVEMASSRDKTLLGAICTVYGENSRDELLELGYESNGITIKGYTSRPAFAQLNRRKQAFFVNGRYVKSPLIASALDEAYKGSLMVNKYPFAVLDITLPYEDVDVNVHPQKTEIRFADSRAVYGCIVKAVSDVLSPTDVFPQVRFESEHDDVQVKPIRANDVTISLTNSFEDEPCEQPVQDSKASKPEIIVEKAPDEVLPQSPQQRVESVPSALREPMHEFDGDFLKITNKSDEPAQPEVIQEVKAEPEKISKTEKISEPIIAPAVKITEETPRKEIITNAQPEQILIVEPEQEAQRAIEFKLCGVLWDTYIMCQSGDTCYIIDQHAAHERLLYDRYSEEFNAKKVLVQQLLIPEAVQAEPFVIDIISENIDVFEELGFDIDIFSNNSCIIRGVPSVACEASFSTVFEEACRLIKQNSSAQNVIRDMVSAELMKSACKHAVKGNQRLSDKEINYIINAVSTMKSFTCPHGRPIAVTLTRKEMEKRFGRIQ